MGQFEDLSSGLAPALSSPSGGLNHKVQSGRSRCAGCQWAVRSSTGRNTSGCALTMGDHDVNRVRLDQLLASVPFRCTGRRQRSGPGSSPSPAEASRLSDRGTSIETTLTDAHHAFEAPRPSVVRHSSEKAIDSATCDWLHRCAPTVERNRCENRSAPDLHIGHGRHQVGRGVMGHGTVRSVPDPARARAPSADGNVRTDPARYAAA